MAKTYPLTALHIAVLLFGISGLFGKFLILPAVFIVFARAGIASLFLVSLRLCQRKVLRVSLSQSWILFWQGCLLAVHWTSFFYAIQISTVAIGLLSYAAFPVFVTLLEPLWFREKLRPSNLFTSLVIFFGLLLVVPEFDVSNNVTRGLLWGVVSALSFAALSLINRKFSKTCTPDLAAAWQNGFAAICLTPFVLGEWPGLTYKEATMLLGLGIFCTAFAHSLFIYALGYIKTRTASVTAALEPVYGVILAYFLFHETPSLRMLVGGFVIVGTVIVSTILGFDEPVRVEH